MENAALKIELLQKLIETDNLEILMKINDILSLENSFLQVDKPIEVYEKTEKVRVFNDWEQARIDIALKQVENGDYISNEEAQMEIEKWFEDQEK